jgi:hypothetical protein
MRRHLCHTYEWRNIDDAFVQGIEMDVLHEVRQMMLLDAYLTLARGEYASVRVALRSTAKADTDRS